MKLHKIDTWIAYLYIVIAIFAVLLWIFGVLSER